MTSSMSAKWPLGHALRLPGALLLVAAVLFCMLVTLAKRPALQGQHVSLAASMVVQGELVIAGHDTGTVMALAGALA
jgi:hypothetical protein